MMDKNLNKRAYQYYESYKDKFKAMCEPLEKFFGISHFGYLRVYYADSKYFYTSNCENLTKEYLTTIESSDIFFEKYLLKNSTNIEERKLFLWPTSPVGDSMELYLRHRHWNGLTIANTDNTEYFECWWFATAPENENIFNFYLRNSEFLLNLTNALNNKILNFVEIRNEVLAHYNKGFSFNIPKDNALSIANARITDFLNEFTKKGLEVKGRNEIVKISKCQIECLQYVAQGMSLKQIGCKLNKSPRTAELHIQNLQAKTGYHIKSDLVNLYNIQIKPLIFP